MRNLPSLLCIANKLLPFLLQYFWVFTIADEFAILLVSTTNNTGYQCLIALSLVLYYKILSLMRTHCFFSCRTCTITTSLLGIFYLNQITYCYIFIALLQDPSGDSNSLTIKPSGWAWWSSNMLPPPWQIWSFFKSNGICIHIGVKI